MKRHSQAHNNALSKFVTRILRNLSPTIKPMRDVRLNFLRAILPDATYVVPSSLLICLRLLPILFLLLHLFDDFLQGVWPEVPFEVRKFVSGLQAVVFRLFENVVVFQNHLIALNKQTVSFLIFSGTSFYSS